MNYKMAQGVQQLSTLKIIIHIIWYLSVLEFTCIKPTSHMETSCIFVMPCQVSYQLMIWLDLWDMINAKGLLGFWQILIEYMISIKYTAFPLNPFF